MTPSRSPARRGASLPWPAALRRLAALGLVLAACGEREALGPSEPSVSLTPSDAPTAAATNLWAAKASMPTARHALAAGEVNGVLYAVGGTYGPVVTTVEAYPPGTNGWVSRAPLPEPGVTG